MKITRLQHLFWRLTQQKLTSEEEAEFLLLWSDPACKHAALQLLDEWYDKDRPAVLCSKEETEDLLRSVLEELDEPVRSVPSVPLRRVRFLNRSGFRYTAAVLLLIASITVWWQVSRFTQKSNVGITDHKQDVIPGGSKAMLTLADGRKIILEGAANGILAQQGNNDIEKLAEGELVYHSQGIAIRGPVEDVQYNTLSTPKGGQYQLRLPDGTRVWLNAESSITYPTAFATGERKVVVSGEAYFEIEKDPKRPFKVYCNGQKIDVLGTSFNMNVYEDEPIKKITLLTGSIRVRPEADTSIQGYRGAFILKPGEQVQIAGTSERKKVTVSNALDEIAWKSGYFNFGKSNNLREVMRQLQRWYDIEVVYEKHLPDIYFLGKISRNVKLSGVLKALEESEVHFRLEEGRRLIVFP